MNSSQEIQTKIASWISEESGWTINSVHGHWINIVQYNPVKRKTWALKKDLSSLKKMRNISNKQKIATFVKDHKQEKTWVKKSIIFKLVK